MNVAHKWNFPWEPLFWQLQKINKQYNADLKLSMNRVNRHVNSVMRIFYKITLCCYLAFGIMSLFIQNCSRESLPAFASWCDMSVGFEVIWCDKSKRKHATHLRLVVLVNIFYPTSEWTQWYLGKQKTPCARRACVFNFRTSYDP
jgi:hypothetical protein